ncbi:MAG: carbohydrate binding family 9 domain-containing protein, partial [Flavobacterium sp.]|nr:carbohydrate binding family 9 domain-containing protein [Flavobacterium sp.]
MILKKQHFTLFLLFSFSVLGTFDLFGQKKTKALRINETISVDGQLDEAVWRNASIARDFIMLEPENGVPESPDRRSEVKVIYDDNAVYIGAILYDNDPSKIEKEITQRDNFGTADHFGIFINGFNDGQQDFRFFVSASGVQMDCLATENGEDFSWDAIWNSEVKITDFGWVVEMEIPYAALRFSKEKIQKWGVNFFREIRRFRQKITWSKIDRAVGSVINQAGILEGIENIKTPTRLFFIPYTSGYVESNDLGTESTFKAGMDIKYGINDSFTLDAILVPDFGQTAFDNVELNLGPFEQQFNENRPFFTEGTDLFSKGNLVYSRRIGGPPSTSPSANENETVENYPNTVNLLNALKVSGRTSEGLGIGFLNAITEKTYARIRNNETNEIREELVEPLSNYNILVFDQRFNQNSSVTFINTNVTRVGDFRDANVTGIVYNVNSKGNKYNFSGDLKMSSIYDNANGNGYSTYINFGKTYGKYRYSIASQYVSKEFDINDLGINFITNYHNVAANFNYRILNPTKRYNSFRLNANYYLELENTTGKAQDHWINMNDNSSTLKNDFIGYGFLGSSFVTYNFYESRVPGRPLAFPASGNAWIYFSSNYNRKFALDIEPSIRIFDQKNRLNYGLFVSPRYRFNDKLTLI